MPDKSCYDRPIDIPVIGEGSQPGGEGDELFHFNASPGPMHTYDMPSLPEPEAIASLHAARNLLGELHRSLQAWHPGKPAQCFDLAGLDAANVDLVNQVLNEGEVSVVYEADTAVHIQESVLTGVWRIRVHNESGQILSDRIEVADIPAIVREKTFANTRPIDTRLDKLPANVLNAPPLLVELAEKSQAWQRGSAHHVINLTLLPLTPEDLLFLGERLGVGPITILSRGYGNCRIGSTAKKNIWWIKYFNSEDKLILNTLEVIDVPEVARAAPEDLADSAIRLGEILDVYGISTGGKP